MRMAVHIERLVLDDAFVALRDPQRIGVAIQAELERQLAIGGLAPDVAVGRGAHTRLKAGDVHIASGASANELGARVAQAVYGALYPVNGERARMTSPHTK